MEKIFPFLTCHSSTVRKWLSIIVGSNYDRPLISLYKFEVKRNQRVKNTSDISRFWEFCKGDATKYWVLWSYWWRPVVGLARDIPMGTCSIISLLCTLAPCLFSALLLNPSLAAHDYLSFFLGCQSTLLYMYAANCQEGKELHTYT